MRIRSSVFDFCATPPYLLHHFFKRKRYIPHSKFSDHFKRGLMIADTIGTFNVQLVVNDGTTNSDIGMLQISILEETSG